MARRSAAALAVVEVDDAGVTRLGVPGVLSAAEKAVWVTTVHSKQSDWFGPEHIPMLIDYVRHIVKQDVIDAQIKAFDPEWLATDDGLRRYEKLITLAAKQSQIANTLARSMRLTHQAIYRKDKAGMGPGKGKKLWQRAQS
jgi:hypothetical protein